MIQAAVKVLLKEGIEAGPCDFRVQSLGRGRKKKRKEK